MANPLKRKTGYSCHILKLLHLSFDRKLGVFRGQRDEVRLGRGSHRTTYLLFVYNGDYSFLEKTAGILTISSDSTGTSPSNAERALTDSSDPTGTSSSGKQS